jgi:competence protein ComGC
MDKKEKKNKLKSSKSFKLITMFRQLFILVILTFIFIFPLSPSGAFKITFWQH